MNILIPQNVDLCIATWNVRSIAENRKTDDLKKIFKRLAAHNVDVACLQETRLRDTGRYQGKKYTLYWSGRQKDRRLNGVGIAVKNTLIDDFEILDTNEQMATDRLLHGRLKTFGGNVNIINVYGPSQRQKIRIKSDFLEKLSLLIFNKIPECEKIYIAGDFNAHVGNDNVKWTKCLGKYGVSKENREGIKLLEFCKTYEMFVTNTNFDIDDDDKMTYYSASHKKEYQIDLIITRFRDRDCVTQTRSHRPRKKFSDHFLVVSKVKIPSILHGEVENVFNSRLRLLSFMLCKYELIDYMFPSVLKKSWETVKISLKIDSNNYVPLILLIQKCLKEANKLIKSYKKTCKKYQNKKSCEFNLRSLRAKKKKIRNHIMKYADFLCKNDVENDQTGSSKHHVTVKNDMKSDTSKSTENHMLDMMFNNLKNDDVIYSNIPILKWKTITEYSEEIVAFDLDNFSRTFNIRVSESTLQLFTQMDKSFLKECILRGFLPREIICTGIIRFENNAHVSDEKMSTKQLCVLKEIYNIFSYFLIQLLQTARDQIQSITSHGILAFSSSQRMIFKIKLLQQEFISNKRPLYVANINLSSILDMICKNKLINFLLKLGCPKKLTCLISHFLGNTRCTIVKSENTIFKLVDEREQDSLLAPILTEMLFRYIVNQAFKNIEPIKIENTNEKGDVNLATIRAFCFGNSFCMFSNSRGELQLCLDNLESWFMRFGLTIESPALQVSVKNRKCQNLKAMVLNVERTESKILFKNVLIPIHDCLILNGVILDSFRQYDKNSKKIKHSIVYHLKVMVYSTDTIEQRIHYYKYHILRKLLRDLEFMIPTQQEFEKLNELQNGFLREIFKNKGEDNTVKIKDILNAESIFNMEANFRYLRLKRLILCLDIQEIYWKINNYDRQKRYSQSPYWKVVLEDLRTLNIQPINIPRTKAKLRDVFIKNDRMHCALEDLFK